MRKRLLDLTGFNRLLNFRHTKTGSIQLANLSLDVLCQHLSAGKEALFLPVPYPTKELYQPLQGSVSGPATSRASGRRVPPPVRDAAQAAGIPSSFELGLAAPTGKPDELQAILYPEDLEVLLRRIGSDARSAIEETGANMLHLAVGFLEYYESADSDKPRLAPLLVLPVSLRKGSPDPRTGVDRYYLEQSGEANLSVNFCLQELLRRDFGIHLPDLEVDEDGEVELPAAYFRRIAPILATQERWRLRTHLTLTLLSFGKLLMHRDLDPRTWPQGTSPADHPLIREFFEASPREGRPEHATEYQLDHPELKPRVPALIDDADSSQHSALVDALEGKNLVIEGPPGTGKSQTITNLIAAAMAQGKRVLFVSEKLAALEVVRSRLNAAGLGTFCLELHSHKTQKRALLDDIARRLRRGTFEDPATYEEKLSLLEDQKRSLNEYSAQLQSLFGVRQKTAYEILGSVQRQRLELRPEVCASVAGVFLPQVAQMSSAQFEERHASLEAFGRHLIEVQQAGNGKAAAHPWFGIQNDALLYHEFAGAFRELQVVRDRTEAFREVGQATAAQFFLPAFGDLAACEKFSLVAAQLPSAASADEKTIIPQLTATASAPTIQAKLANLTKRLRTAKRLRREVGDALGSEADLLGRQPERLRHACGCLTKSCPFSVTIEEVGKTADYYTALAGQLSEVLSASTTLIQSLGRAEAGVDADALLLAELSALANIVDLAATAPSESLHLRALLANVEAAAPFLCEAKQEAAPLLAVRSELEARFRLTGLPSAEILGRMAAAVASAGVFRFFDKEYQNAKKTYRGLCRLPDKSSRAVMQADLHRLADYRDRWERFHAKPVYREALGGVFDGLDTPFEKLERLFDWLLLIGKAVPNRPNAVTTRLASGLRTGSPEQISQIGSLIADTPHWQNLEKNLHECQQNHWPKERPFPDKLAELVTSLQSLAAELREAVATLTDAKVKADVELPRVGAALDALSQARLIESGIASDNFAATTLGEYFKAADTDADLIEATLELVRSIRTTTIPVATQNWLLEADTATRLLDLKAAATRLADNVKQLRKDLAIFAATGNVDWTAWFGLSPTTDVPIDHVPFMAFVSRADCALSHEAQLSGYVAYLRAKQTALRLKLDPIVERVEAGQFEARCAHDAFSFVYSESLARALLADRPALDAFSGMTHEGVRQRFAALDKEVIALYRRRAASLIANQRKVPWGVSSGPVGGLSQRGLLEREIKKQKKHLPIRKLLDRAGEALQALKPCFMMGPLSVAQFLKPGGLTFDLIVMDEASQLRPEEALGAITRGTQLVVVGDPKQLPPTDFFKRLTDDAEDEDEPEEVASAAQAESILDVASALYQPLRRLRWHYRSRHESLIAFSNREFYDGDLMVFPSPAASNEGLGVKFEAVPDGRFVERRNVPEAERVVAAALVHMRNYPDRSLGIVALNAPQKELIEALFEQRAKSEPSAAAFVERWSNELEPFFIKNLENVQGDERDVIIVSVTYGRSAPGLPVPQRFGPINGPTGHRRLNVLITRAKRQLLVFSSITADDVRVSSESSHGLRALKGYLAFAQSGRLDGQATVTGREADSDFEVAVATAVRARGYEVVPQIGVAGYFVDLGLRDPRKTDAFLLGIECDGATYHRSRCARDRDRLRQQVLEGLGWNIHRVWSTDWFKDRQREVEKIVARIQELLAKEVRVEAPTGSKATDVEAVEPSSARQNMPTDGRFVQQELISHDAPDPVAIAKSEAVEQNSSSMEQVRRRLIEIRENVIKPAFPRTDAAKGLLRKSMLDILLRERPQTYADWIVAVPAQLRVETDQAQVSRFLENVLAILRKDKGL